MNRKQPNILKYVEWHRERWCNLPLTPQTCGPDDLEQYTTILVDYVHELRANGAKRTVPKARLASLAFLNKMAGLDVPLPVHDVALVALAQSHCRNATNRGRATTTVYTVPQVRLMEMVLCRCHPRWTA